MTSLALARSYTYQTRLILVLKAVTSLRMEHSNMDQSDDLKAEMQRLAWELFSKDPKCKAPWAFNRALEWITARNEFIGPDTVVEEREVA